MRGETKPVFFFGVCEHGHGINLEIETGSSSGMPVRHTMTMNESCVLFAINFRLLLQPAQFHISVLLVKGLINKQI